MRWIELPRCAREEADRDRVWPRIAGMCLVATEEIKVGPGGARGGWSLVLERTAGLPRSWSLLDEVMADWCRGRWLWI